MKGRIDHTPHGRTWTQPLGRIPGPVHSRWLVPALLLGLAFARPSSGQPAHAVADETPPRPRPNWVELVDAGSVQADLKGATVLAGVQVRQVAHSPLLAGVAALAFDAQGRPYTLSLSAESRAAVGPAVPAAERAAASSPRGQIVLWRGGNADGPWNQPQVWMDDLDAPRGLLVHEGWYYWLSRGRLLRRRPYDDDVAQRLARAAEAGRAAPAGQTRDQRWLEQELLSGLEVRDELPSGGLSLTPQGWLYLSVGSGRHRVRSWDGRQVAVPASGAVLRLRPDGSHLEVWARGLVGPTAVTWDSLHNEFLVDAGSRTPFLPRLIQLWQGADYGWRQARAASTESGSALRPDPLRAADPAQRPGCLPPLMVWRPLEPTAALLWLGDGLDARLHGQLLVADAGQGAVHVFGLELRPTGTRVAWQFPLLDLRPLGLVPTALAEGPDGALYVAARPTKAGADASGRPAEGRIWRLAMADAPAVSANRWEALATASDEELLGILETAEGDWPRRALEELLLRAARDEAAGQRLRVQLVAQALNTTRPPKARAMALAGLSRLGGTLAISTLLNLLSDDDPEMVQLAADAVADLAPAAGSEPPEGLSEAIEAVQSALGRTTHPRAERALRLALGRWAAAGGGLEAAEWNFESMSVTDRPRTPRIVFDAHVRALEMVPGAARELLIGNLDVAINFPQAEERERQRIKEFVVRTAEAMRTGELTAFLDALLAAEEDLAGKLEGELAARLMACYGHAETEPPPVADALAAWLERHLQAPAVVQVAALQTLGLVGTSRPEALEALLDQRFRRQPVLAIPLAERWLQGQLAEPLKPYVLKALARQAADDAKGSAARLLEQIQRAAP